MVLGAWSAYVCKYAGENIFIKNQKSTFLMESEPSQRPKNLGWLYMCAQPPHATDIPNRARRISKFAFLGFSKHVFKFS